MRYKQEIRAEAERQSKLLRDFRAEKEKQNSKRNHSFFFHGLDSEDTEGSFQPQRNAGIVPIVLESEAQWAVFEDKCRNLGVNETLSEHDVPWIPTDITGVDYLKTLGRRMKGYELTGDPFKKVYTKMCLRWHPDKFQHKYMPIFQTSEWEKILEKVHFTAQYFNAAWEELQGEG